MAPGIRKTLGIVRWRFLHGYLLQKILNDKIVGAYLYLWARMVVFVRRPYVIAVTGPAGKTTTIGMISTLLAHPSARRLVGTAHSTMANMNNDLGVPFTILLFDRWISRGWARLGLLLTLPFRAFRLAFLPGYPDVLVLEIAAGSRSHVSRSARLAPPDVAVVTNVGPAHLESLGSIEGVAREKGLLVKAVPATGLVIVGGDHDHREYLERLASAPVVCVEGIGVELARNVAGAVAAHFDIPPEATLAALADYKPIAGRLNCLKTGLFVVIDDCYNANPLSMKLGLDTLEAVAAESVKTARRVAVLGQMNELGPGSAAYHEEIGAYAHDRADVVMGVGELARHYRPHHWFPDSQQCAVHVAGLVANDDCILVKGSASLSMRMVVDKLVEAAVETSA